MDNNMIDIGFVGPRFTWSRGGSQSRIDRVFINGPWHEEFTNDTITHLPKYKSDHCPILLKPSQVDVARHMNRPFRFLASWVMHAEFSEFVKTHWHMKGKIYRKLECLESKITKAGLNARLEEIRKDLWHQLEEILNQEQVMWLQLSRCKWYTHSDRNTKYFHSMANSQRRHNRIGALRLDSGVWVYDTQEIMSLGSKFFQNLYSEEGSSVKQLHFDYSYPTLDSGCLESFKRVLFDMGSLKAPGLDGLNPLFYQSQWDTVKDSIVDQVNLVFQNLASMRNPTMLQDVIEACVSSPSMQLMWNGERGVEFHPSRGVRQGDPLSPYLFVIAIERLAHLI
ncbi:uncharacterized protein LOC114723285 [Neltuma alba]|uniref:uncharacterized protein LOC114723285 n=1 Tax=Neltuma alba TaxID=207710 RepID=UPI0010A352C7|nr:uncharacterized protein LOC114723285 [Prosopis alba]